MGGYSANFTTTTNTTTITTTTTTTTSYESIISKSPKIGLRKSRPGALALHYNPYQWQLTPISPHNLLLTKIQMVFHRVVQHFEEFHNVRVVQLLQYRDLPVHPV